MDKRLFGIALLALVLLAGCARIEEDNCYLDCNDYCIQSSFNTTVKVSWSQAKRWKPDVANACDEKCFVKCKEQREIGANG